jgi:hypothetical protein
MKKIALVMVVGLAVLLLTPTPVKTQGIVAPMGQPVSLTLTSGCYYLYSITYNTLYSDVVNILIAPNGLIAGYDTACNDYPVCGKKTGADFVAIFDFPWETCGYYDHYGMGFGTGLKAWITFYDPSGNPSSPEHIQFVPCWMVGASKLSGRYLGQDVK